MLKILQISDNIDTSLRLDPAELTGDAIVDMKSPYITGFKAGMGVTIGIDGYVAIAADGNGVIGLVVNDAEGVSFENTPAVASGIIPAITGGLVHTDMVRGDVAVGTHVYMVNGKVQSDPVDAGNPSFGLVMEGNTVTDGPITYRFSASF